MKIKLIILAVLSLLLCGCENWEDIYSSYGNILDKGISCEYSLVGDVEMGAGIKSIDLSANKNGIYVSYNHGSKKTIVNSKNEFSALQNFNNYEVAYNNFNYKRYLNSYSKTNTCPSNIYIYVDSYYNVTDNCPQGYTCYSYSTKSVSGNNQGSDKDDTPEAGKCHVSTAIDCKTYRKELYGKYIYLELGYEKLANGSEGRYFIVTDQPTYYGGSVARDSDDLINDWGPNIYMIMNPEKIYSSNNGTYSFNDIKINMNNAGLGYNIYYIAATNDNEALGDFEQGAANEYNPDTGEEGSKEIPDLEIEEIDFCEQDGVRKTFQIVGYILYVAKIIVPLLLIIMGTIDFAKATISSDDKAPKEAVATLIKRVLIAVIIFLIPTILNFLLSLVNGATETFTDSKFTDCTDCLLDPFGDCKAEDIKDFKT